MNALLATGVQPPTMSSREIADLTGSTHDNVLKTVRRLVADGVVSGNETPYLHPQNGQTYNEFRLSFRDTMVVVSGYNADLRAKIIDRWQELESSAAPALNLRDIRHLAPIALQLVGLVQEQQAQLEAQAPKVRFAEAIGAAENDQKVGEVAKALGVGPRKLLAFMKDNGVLMSNGLPFQHHLECHRFRVSEVPYTDPNTGSKRMRLETRVTGRGVTFLQQRLAKQREVTHG